MNREEAPLVEEEAIGRSGRLERRRAARHIQHAHDKLPALHRAKEFADAGGLAEWLQHDLDGAAARKAQAVCILRCDAALHRLGPPNAHPFAPNAIDEVVFDAAARYRSDHEPIVTYGEHRTFGARR